MTTPDPTSLIHRFRNHGDTEAFGTLLSLYDQPMYATAFSILRNDADANDAVQDAAIRAMQNLDALADPQRFGGWLMRIVFGCSIDRLRTRRDTLSLDHDNASEPLAATHRPGDHLDAREWAEQLNRALDQLPPRYRAPLLLFHLDGLSTQQVAQHLDIPAGTARSLLSRARGRLSDLFPDTTEGIPDMAHDIFREQQASNSLVAQAELGCLHVMNGDAAADQLRQAEPPDPIVVWSDILHEGPTPVRVSPDAWRQTRAEHLAAMGFGDAVGIQKHMAAADAALANPGDGRERVFWFEHDLYDQLLLIRHLHWLAQHDPATRSRVSLICIGEFPGIPRFLGLGQLQPDQIISLLDTRLPLTADHIELGQRVWEDFCSCDPQQLRSWLDRDTAHLPFLDAALRRHFQQYPSTFNGLGLTEQLLLEELQAESLTASELFAKTQAREAAPFLGDAVVYHYLQRLVDAPTPPMVMAAGDERVTADTRLELTDFGRQLLSGEADFIKANGIDRWFGGVHLTMDQTEWRWDNALCTLVRV
ncbi:RNA polymerase sigma factor [Algisphaera agarilytica]|uniref:RNA polymerase sigma factor (Sigma-70 family) n=1 Tax=Algisphaera agarilytica TaxID=1385975 RepID=A0A7X0H511_9BACT|nr:sigma-70 family RNA polymerase sigma factor [Algisphaera agarilytica]MBB6429350.1 RNA polymerase sigma factor (sigma-70 family) [Algisphaera agarilytica]